QPDRVVNVKNALDATVTSGPGGGLRIGAAMKMVGVAEHAQIGRVESVRAGPGGGLRCGAAMKMVDVAEHAQIVRMYPAIAAAAIEVGTPKIRNQGTVGGNLNQRPRCWYYRNRECVVF